MNWYYVIAVVLFIIGIVINISINRRRFYRRGAGGLQHYNSYGKAVLTTWLERLGKLLVIVLILFAIGFASMGYTQQQKEKKATGRHP
jgi:hypothetical protein